MKVHISQWLLKLLVPCDLSRGAMSRGQTMLSEVQKSSMGLCTTWLPRAVGLQPIDKKELSWGTARKSSSILAESKYRKSQGHLISYLTRNRPMIPAYAVRREWGLRHSSHRGEKSHDLIVAERQKHNGMSWSKDGSVALASVTALKKNKEYKKWFQEGEIEFKLAS